MRSLFAEFGERRLKPVSQRFNLPGNHIAAYQMLHHSAKVGPGSAR